MQLVDPQRYVLPGLLVLLVLGVAVIVATNGAGDEPARSQEAPAQTAPARGATQRRVVRVRPGQTPTSIARDAGITVDRLLELNPSVDPATLRPGQRLKIRQ